jgi:hypothetical protein
MTFPHAERSLCFWTLGSVWQWKPSWRRPCWIVCCYRLLMGHAPITRAFVDRRLDAVTPARA